MAHTPAGVVLDADGLSEEHMRALARELGGRDTAFLLRPDAPDHDLRMALIEHVLPIKHRQLQSRRPPL